MTLPDGTINFLPAESLLAGKWYAINDDPLHSRSATATPWAHVVAGPFETETEGVQWFEDHPNFGGEYSSVQMFVPT